MLSCVFYPLHLSFYELEMAGRLGWGMDLFTDAAEGLPVLNVMA